MYLTLRRQLAEIGFDDRLVSAEKITSSLRARKTTTEIQRIQQAIEHTLDIYSLLEGHIKPGETEKEIAALRMMEPPCSALPGKNTQTSHLRPSRKTWSLR